MPIKFTITINFALDARLRLIAKHFQISQADVLRRAVGLMLVAADEVAVGNRIVVIDQDDKIIKEFILDSTNKPKSPKKWFGFFKS